MAAVSASTPNLSLVLVTVRPGVRALAQHAKVTQRRRLAFEGPYVLTLAVHLLVTSTVLVVGTKASRHTLGSQIVWKLGSLSVAGPSLAFVLVELSARA